MVEMLGRKLQTQMAPRGSSALHGRCARGHMQQNRLHSELNHSQYPEGAAVQGCRFLTTAEQMALWKTLTCLDMLTACF